MDVATSISLEARIAGELCYTATFFWRICMVVWICKEGGTSMGYLDDLLGTGILGRKPFVSREQKIEQFLIAGMLRPDELNLRIAPTPWSNARDNLVKAGINENVLLRVLLRVAMLQSRKEEPKRLRNLQDMLRRARGLNKTLFRQFGLEFKEAFEGLKSLCRKIELELKEWPKKSGKGRGIGPQTPLIVALVAYVQERTGRLHCEDIATLISLAHKAAGSGKTCKPASLLQLFKRNRALQKDWQVLMGFKHGPKTHAPGALLGRAFRPPKALSPQTNRPKQNTYVH